MLEGPAHALLNRVLSAYVANLDASQLKLGLWAGDIRLTNLRLKKEALDKFRLPIDVIEGYIGELRLQVPWAQLRSQPVKAYVNNIYLLAVPAASTRFDAEDDERRKQAVKQEKLANAEVLSTRTTAAMSVEEQAKNESLAQSFTNRIVDNLQIEIANIHIRYEDNLSVPGHPFAVGFTLAGFKAFSTDENWEPTFLHNALKGVHKIAQLDSLAIYFNTDTESLSGYSPDEAITRFTDLIATARRSPEHQFVLRPVSGKAKLILRRSLAKGEAKTDMDLGFDELGFVLDEDQYRDALSMLDLFHFYTRQYQYRPLRPSEDVIAQNKPRALLNFALVAIRKEVHEKHRRWTWDYFRERRDDRKEYVRLFKLAQRHQLPNRSELDALERKLDYKDIRFYRSIARSEITKERAAQKQEEKEHPPPAANKGWLGWIWGGSQNKADDAPGEGEVLNDAQRKELYDAIDFNEATAVPDVDLPPDALKVRVKTDLRRGTFALKRNPRGGTEATDLVSIVFDAFRATFLQRVEGLVASVALGSMGVFDGTRTGTLHPQIVRVKEDKTALIETAGKQAHATELPAVSADNPFFFFEFENQPLDGRADAAVALRMRYLEIIYHRGYVEEIVRFFKPPESQLESVNALIDVASETLEGIRKETRAGLEYALEKHRTIDLRVDMNAPIIVVPEDVTKEICQHVVLDAGHISVESELVEKGRLDDIRKKQAQQYSEKDFQQLEDLMYDRFFIRLESAQLLMGDTLEACLNALEGHTGPELHVLERISMTFKAENSILPKAPNLTRIRVSGELPDLRVNFSDRKYKILMRMIDVALPNFDEVERLDKVNDAIPTSKETAASQISHQRKPSTFVQAPMYLTGKDEEYNVDEESSDADNEDDEDDTFVLAPDLVEGGGAFKQKQFVFSFTVKKLAVAIFKSDTKAGSGDRLLAIANLEHFSLDFALRSFDMSVDILLRSLYIDDKMVEDGSNFQRLITSDQVEDQDEADEMRDLVSIKYMRVQPNSPEFMSVHEGISQSVDIEMATINVILTRASILMLFDFILTTFTDPEAPSTDASPTENLADGQPEASPATVAADKIRVKIRLTSFGVVLNDDGLRIATLSLKEATVGVLLRGPTMRVSARLGDLMLKDDLSANYIDASYSRILMIEGQEVADFVYETYDPNDSHTYPGYGSLVQLRTGSLRLTVLEHPARRILQFLTRFARMKAVLDSARAAAAASAAGVQPTDAAKMHFDILVRTPILVFPLAEDSSDCVVANLGELKAVNKFEDEQHSTISASVSAIKLTSETRPSNRKKQSPLKMLEDLDFSVEIAIREDIDRSKDSTQPDMQMTASLTDVKMNLTQLQYGFLMQLAQSIPRVLESEDDDDAVEAEVEPALPPAHEKALIVRSEDGNTLNGHMDSPTVDLLPELPVLAHAANGAEIRLFPKMELLFKLRSIHLELYGEKAVDVDSMKDNSLARFAFHQTELRMRTLSNDAMEAELLLKSFTIRDTHISRQTRFRDIVPAAKHDAHQFMLSYTMSGANERSGVANLTIDNPTFVFTLEPLFALATFFLSAFGSADENEGDRQPDHPLATISEDTSAPSDQQQQPWLTYRVNIVGAKVMLLAEPNRTDSEALVLSIKQILLSQEHVLLLDVSQMGMFLCRMDKQSDRVRLLDNFNLTVSMDSNAPRGRTMSSIEINVDPLVFRVSYRDIMLVTSIFNKASELAGRSSQDNESTTGKKALEQQKASQVSTSPDSRRTAPRRRVSSAGRSARQPSRAPQMQYIVSSEQLKATFSGFQLILIGDVHELPILDIKTGKLMLRASEWSKELRADVIISPYINFFNLSTSHWEPLLDPWEFAIHLGKRLDPDGIDFEINAKKRAEINITATFVDLVLTALAVWDRERDTVLKTDRGHGAPFLIRNRTGYKIFLWNAADVHKHSSTATPTELENGRDKPWRFEDWKTMRENLSASHNSLAVLFDGVAWERLRHVAVDREGEHIYTLKPKVDGTFHRMLCDVKLVDNVKHVTLRSTVQVQNLTLVPAEMVVVDEKGKRDSPIFKIPPAGECSVPIQAAYSKRIRVRPDSGFGYNWSETKLHWQDMVKRPRRLVTCAPKENHSEDADFRFETFALHDKADPLIRHYPRISLRLRVPMEIENLLPYDVRYRLYDKNLQRNYTSYLRKGGLTPVAIADIEHLLLLSIEVQDTNFKRSDFAIVSTDNPEDMPQETVITVEDHDGMSMNLKIEYHKYPESGKAFKVQIYSPYAFINKTGLDFSLKTKAYLGSLKNVAGLKMYSTDPSRKEAKPFLFNYPTSDRRNRALISVDGSDFSVPTSFETIGADNALSMSNAKGSSEIHIGMRVAEGLGAFKLTKVVTIYPRFIVKNNTNERLRLRASGSEDRTLIGPGQRQSVFWLPSDADFKMSASFENSKWSPVFSIQDIGRMHVRAEHHERGQQLLLLDAVLEGPTIFLRFSLESGKWPFLLRNNTSQPLSFAQSHAESADIVKRYDLPPQKSVPYAWDEPSREGKIIRLAAPDGTTRDITIMEIGAQVPWRFRSREGIQTLSMDISTEDSVQVLLLTPYIEEESLYKLQRRPTDTLSRQNSQSGIREVTFEAAHADSHVSFSFTVSFAGVGISVVDRQLRELIYVSFRGLRLEYKDMTDRQSVSLITQWIQIDNQLKNCLFPIILYPTRAPKDEQDLQAHPNLQLSIVLLKDQAHGVMFFKYATLLIQEMSVEIDEAFLYAVMDFAKFKGVSWEEPAPNQLTDEPAEVPEPEGTNVEAFVFFEALHLQPIQVDLSFMRTETDEKDPRTFLDNRSPVAFALNALTMALGNVNEAPVQLRALFIENVRSSWPVLIDRITLHYKTEAVGQLYRVLGSADFIGNPVGLFKNVTSGVSDLWYEPFAGVALYGDRDIPFGVARGAGSLIRKSVFGVSDSFAKVTGSIGKGLSAASLDAEWQAKRRAAMRRNKPKHAFGGIGFGAQSLVTDVASGIEGVFTKPIEGLEKDGAAGLFRGMGKGMVGMFAKPAVGVLDFLSNTATGIRNTTTLFEGGAIERVRHPRFVASDGVLRPYSEREALGQSWLHSLGFRYEKETYVAHLVLGGQDDTAVILTEARILLIQSVRLRVMWDVPLSELKTISMEPKGLQLVLRTGDNGPFLPITSDANRDWLFSHFKRVVSAWNATTGS